MAKVQKQKPYEGDLQHLVKFATNIPSEVWVVKFQGKTIGFDNGLKKMFHRSAGYAKNALTHHIYCNYCQGHYWHKGLNNTFEKERGWERNCGIVGQSEREFKVFAKETVAWLLEQKIFTIEPVAL